MTVDEMIQLLADASNVGLGSKDVRLPTGKNIVVTFPYEVDDSDALVPTVTVKHLEIGLP